MFPFSFEGVLVTINLWAMYLVTPCLVPPPYVPQRIIAFALFAFWLSFAMLLINLYLWLRLMGL